MLDGLIYKKYFDIEIEILPSPSPAYQLISYEAKREKYYEVLVLNS